jgi:cytochrome P450
MPLVSELELPRIDHTDPALRGERYRREMTSLRGYDGWLAAQPFGYLVLDREAGEFFLRTRSAVFPALTLVELFGICDGALHEEIVKNIIARNGPDHGRLRNLVNPALTPRRVDRYRPAMREFAATLFDSMPPDKSCEFIESFAKPYPAMVIAHVIGAPLSDGARLHRWSGSIQRQFDPISLTTVRDAIEQSVSECYAYIDALIEQRRGASGEDLITDLIAAEQAGDRLSNDELRNLVLNLLVGGIDTSQSQLAHTVRLLAEAPEQWALLRADPRDLAPRAVEEAIRYEPITPFTARITLEQLEHRGVTFPAGSVVLVSAWHANRDDVAQERFDITAERTGTRVLTFGAGIHNCVGASLARAEIAEAIVMLAERVGTLSLDGEPQFGTPSGIYSLESLPLRLEFIS